MMMQSAINCCDLTAIQSITKRQKFLARKIHKIKKILKLRSKPSSTTIGGAALSLEERQNAENERMFEKFVADGRCCPCEVEQNSINENWENWDACQMCATVEKKYGPTIRMTNTFDYEDRDRDHFSTRAYPERRPPQSICYVFMPNQYEPVPVRLRTARIPGGVLCVSYRPDVDIRNSNYPYSYTSFQQPQAQQALRPIMV